MLISVNIYCSNYTVMLSLVSRVVSDQLLYLWSSADKPPIFFVCPYKVFHSFKVDLCILVLAQMQLTCGLCLDCLPKYGSQQHKELDNNLIVVYFHRKLGLDH